MKVTGAVKATGFIPDAEEEQRPAKPKLIDGGRR